MSARITERVRDAPLETLFLPFTSGQLRWPEDGVLFLRARDGLPLRERPHAGVLCQQTFKPDAAALQRAGFEVVATERGAERRFPLVLVLPPRQRDEARALFARAIDAVEPGGHVVAAASNDEGARSAEGDLERIAGPVTTLTKNRCRVFWSGALQTALDSALVREWRDLDAPRPIAAGRFVSRPGIFAWDRIDAGSALLAEHFPAGLAGRAADLGAGFGYLSAELLGRCAGITALDLYEAEARALDLAQQNLAAFAQRAALAYHWHDVTTGLAGTYDVIVCNPPFHTHARTDRPDLGRSFVTMAARSLNPGGQLWLVANRHLAYERVLHEAFDHVRIVTQERGYKVFAAR